MLLALALASSLWAAAQEAGARASDVSPGETFHDSMRGRLRDSESLCLIGQRPRPRSEDFHFIFGKSRVRVGRSEQRDMTTLGGPVRIVVGIGPKPEVADVHAPPVRPVTDWVSNIAGMENPLSVWNWAVLDYPSEAMGHHHLPADAHLSIASGVDLGSPEPAVVWTLPVDMEPKLLLRRQPASASPAEKSVMRNWSELATAKLTGDVSFDHALIVPDHAAQTGQTPVEIIADDYGRDLAWVVGSHAADLYSTAWALRRGASEANPLGPDVESRLALKMASCATTGLSLWKLRRDGHGKTATIIRWLYVAGNAALVVNNVYQGSRK